MEWVFRGKVNRVLTPSKVLVSVDLGFKVKVQKEFNLTGFDIPELQYDDAYSCLILLIGGHRVIIKTLEPVSPESEVWNTKIYLGSPINLSNVYEVVSEKRIPCVNKIMNQLSENKYNPEAVKKIKVITEKEIKESKEDK